jgi:pimeloyl-ACP methyl ester carboxylesterase
MVSDALNNTWDWMGKDLTLVTIPDAGHFGQQDAADLVTSTIRAWLNR